MSWTKNMRSGAIFGGGVYLTEDLNLARLFSEVSRPLFLGTAPRSGFTVVDTMAMQVSDCWSHSYLGPELEIVGVFELVNMPEAVRCQRDVSAAKHHVKSDVPEKYFICTDTAFCRLTGLLVWRKQQVRLFGLPCSCLR